MKVTITNSISCQGYDDLEEGQPFQWANSGTGVVCLKISASKYLMCSPWHPSPRLDTVRYRGTKSVVPLVLDSINAHAGPTEESDTPWE